MKNIETTNDLAYLLRLKLPPHLEEGFYRDLIKTMGTTSNEMKPFGLSSNKVISSPMYIIDKGLDKIRTNTIIHELGSTNVRERALAVMETQKDVDKKIEEVLILRRKYINMVPPLEREFLKENK